jgi:manganese/zinc/iron transport system substrate-binding protein
LINATRFGEELRAVHREGVNQIESIPAANRVLVTSHDAFGYFGRAYGIEVRGVQGISTESEAGLQQINQLVDLLVDRKLPAVFVESSVPRKSIEAVVAGAAARQQKVEVAGPLFADAMGEAGTAAGTYAGMMRHNFRLIAESLSGKPDSN